MIQVDACRWVDDIILYKTEAQLYDLIKRVHPDVRFLGEDHKGKPFTGDDLPIKIIFNTRKHHYSTSNLRDAIFFAEFKKKVLKHEI
jgi:glycerol-3-phosphate cytidylyltransferase-like family protein